jgi:hypothetical protein
MSFQRSKAVSKACLDPEEASADKYCGKREESTMDVGAALVADGESPEAVDPCEGAFNDPAVPPKALGRFDATTSDAWNDAPCATRCPGFARVECLVAVQLVGSEAGTADGLLDGWDAVQQRLEQRGVGDVGSAQLDCEWDALAVDEKVVFRPGPAAIRRVRADFIGAPFFAAMLEPSIAARDQSMAPRSPSSSSTNRCSAGQTPTSVQSRILRQQVTPEPQPISSGNMRHWMPVRRTNRIPVSAARSGTRGRPPSGFGGSGGSNGSIRSHSASDTSGFAMGSTTYPSIAGWAKF